MNEPKCCPLEILLSHISGQWTLYIIWVLNTNGALRFGELRRKVEGISTKVLTERLRLLESIELVHRHHEPTIPPQVTYTLTERSKELSVTLDHLYELAVRWYGNDKKAVSQPKLERQQTKPANYVLDGKILSNVGTGHIV